jgi:hypothetical protein
MNQRIVRILLLVAAMVCFFGTALFIDSMEPNETWRFVTIGLGLFAASFVP